MIDVSAIPIKRSHRRSVSLHVLPDGTIEAKAPLLMPTFIIRDFIKKHVDWIEKATKKSRLHAAVPKQYREGEMFVYLGNQYALTIGDFRHIAINGAQITFPRALAFRVKKEIEQWYIKQARKVIGEQVASCALVMHASYAGISYSDTSSKWGSCTHDNRLQFNWRLIMAPLLVLRYVVVHELAHTFEKNHSRTFWSKVRMMNPSYREQIKWLRTHGSSLVV